MPGSATATSARPGRPRAPSPRLTQTEIVQRLRDNRGLSRRSSLHTHTPDGVTHMQADDPYPYTRAHVMTTWGVAFDADRLGGDTANGPNKVYVYVNGEPAAPDVELADGDNVVVAYGEDGSFPVEPDDSALDAA